MQEKTRWLNGYSASDSGLRGPGHKPDRGHCVTIMQGTLLSQCPSPSNIRNTSLVSSWHFEAEGLSIDVISFTGHLRNEGGEGNEGTVGHIRTGL